MTNKNQSYSIPGYENPTKIIIVRNNHTRYRNALVNKDYNFVGNLSRISEAREKYERDIKIGTVRIVRDFGYTFDMASHQQMVKDLGKKIQKICGVSKDE